MLSDRELLAHIREIGLDSGTSCELILLLTGQLLEPRLKQLRRLLGSPTAP